MTSLEDITAARQALGSHLAALRRADGVSQQDLAARVYVSRSTVANVERGRQRASREFWERCDATAFAQRSDGDALAVLHLLEAERLAPQLIRVRPDTRRLVTDLLVRERRSATPDCAPRPSAPPSDEHPRECCT